MLSCPGSYSKKWQSWDWTQTVHIPPCCIIHAFMVSPDVPLCRLQWPNRSVPSFLPWEEVAYGTAILDLTSKSLITEYSPQSPNTPPRESREPHSKVGIYMSLVTSPIRHWICAGSPHPFGPCPESKTGFHIMWRAGYLQVRAGFSSFRGPRVWKVRLSLGAGGIILP